jgi:hypothetical protein
LRPLGLFFAVLLAVYLVEKAIGLPAIQQTFTHWLTHAAPFVQQIGVVELPRGGATLFAPRGVRATLSLRRFATASFPIVVGTLEGAARLAIPTDRSTRPWQLQVDANGPVTLCPV